MNCPEYHDLLQRLLDGETAVSATELTRHEQSCSACRGLQRAARLLQEGLRPQTLAFPDPRLTERIVRQTLRDRAQRRRMHVLAIAAGLLLTVGVGYGLLRPTGLRSHDPVVAEVVPTRIPSVSESIREAGEAFAALTRRTAGETVGPSGLLLPDLAQMPLASDSGIWEETLEEPARSLREAGQGVSVALEPVTASAKRALSMFLRDIPTVQRERNPGS